MRPHDLSALWAGLGGVLLCWVTARGEHAPSWPAWLAVAAWLGTYALALHRLTCIRR